jgi:hypothetical protein
MTLIYFQLIGVFFCMDALFNKSLSVQDIMKTFYIGIILILTILIEGINL